MSDEIESMETWGGVPAAAARLRGDPALPLGATENGWWYETQDGRRWFVPQDVATTIHRGSHDCPGGCPALASFTVWPAPGAPDEESARA